MLRLPRTLALLAAIATSVSCKTVEDPLPPQSALNFDVSNTTIASQRTPLPAPQVVTWRVEEMTATNIPGFDGTYSFLFSGPCSYQLNALQPISFVDACRTSGLTLTPGSVATSAVFRLTISRLELRTAARPDLSAGADPDGDGIPNLSDNCPIVANPDQSNDNSGAEGLPVGNACSIDDASGNPTIADQDADGLGDVIDNCTWYPNSLPPGELLPPDSNRDGIGDACERIAPVVLPNGRLTVECDDVTFTTLPSTISFFRIDFGAPGVLTCDAAFTGCTIHPSAMKLVSLNNGTTFACHAVN